MSNHRMAPSEPLLLALEHNAWATHEVLRACTALGDEQWHQRFEMGSGSLHDTLTHVVGAMFRWADRIDEPPRAVRPSIEDGSRRTPAELTTLLHVTTHGMHHRAQCLNMLRHLAVPGVSDRLPEIDVLEWQIRTAEAFGDRGPMQSAGA
jgi:uncharacterized damage-inducible protein DinB